MERVISVVLTGSSFLLKAGLEAFLSEFSYVSTEATFDGTEPALDTKIIKLKPDIVFLEISENPEQYKPLLQSLSKEKTITLIAVTELELPDAVRGKLSEIVSLKTDKMVLTQLMNRIFSEKGKRSVQNETDRKLSEREIDILRHVAYGHTNQEIADKLFLSIHTVTTHRKNITRKLGIKTVSGLTVYALMNKMVKPSEVEH